LPALPALAIAAISAAESARPLTSSTSSINPVKKPSIAVVGHKAVELYAPMKAVSHPVSTEPNAGLLLLPSSTPST